MRNSRTVLFERIRVKQWGRGKAGLIYAHTTGPLTKIGLTARLDDSRLREHQTGNPHKLKCIYLSSPYKGARLIESYIHKELERLGCGGGTEWFNLNECDAVELLTEFFDSLHQYMINPKVEGKDSIYY